MTSNDRIILDEVLTQKKAQLAPELTDSDFFGLFAAEQLMKNFDLSYDEIESGIVDGGNDGGIDAIYVLANGELVQEDADLGHLKKSIVIDVVVVQSKTTPSFSESALDKLIAASQDLLDLSKSIKNLKAVYNTKLLAWFDTFRQVHRQLASRFPEFRITYHYATKGDEPHPNVQRKVSRLEETVKARFPSAAFSFGFLGASGLLVLARTAPKTTHELTLAETPISSSGAVAFVCLVRMHDFHRFVTDKSGALQRNLFESNVRDYQGRTEVNDAIRKSLREPQQEDFWWLNNGVTIIAAKASQSAKTLTIEDPQIVNGLQTSTEVFEYFNKSPGLKDDRNVLVRVLVPSKSESRDRIIRATNSQTIVPPASLRATDKIHRDIEEFLRPRGFYYERRKNFYKNDGKPRDRVVGIPDLGQAVMAIVLQTPNTARARPSSLLKKDDDYTRIFSPKHPIAVFHVCAALIKKVEQVLRSDGAAVPASDRNNVRYYVAMHFGATLCGKAAPTAEDIAQIDISGIQDAAVLSSVTTVMECYSKLGGTDRVAKGIELVVDVKSALEAR